MRGPRYPHFRMGVSIEVFLFEHYNACCVGKADSSPPHYFSFKIMKSHIQGIVPEKLH